MSGIQTATAVKAEMTSTKKALKAKQFSPWVFLVWNPPRWATPRPLGEMLTYLPRVGEGRVEELEKTVGRLYVEFGRYFGQRVPNASEVTGWRPAVVMFRPLGRHRVKDLMWVLNELSPTMGVSEADFSEQLPSWVSDEDAALSRVLDSAPDRLSPASQFAHSTTLDQRRRSTGSQGR